MARSWRWNCLFLLEIVWSSLLILMGLRFGLLRDVKELLYSGFTLTRMDLFDRKLVTEDSMLSFTFNSRRELTIVVLQIVSKAFSMSRHTAAKYAQQHQWWNNDVGNHVGLDSKVSLIQGANETLNLRFKIFWSSLHMAFVNTFGHYLFEFCLLLFELEFTVRITIASC